MNDNLISVIDAASELGMHKQTLFKVIKRLSINTTKIKSSENRGQTISYISNNDFNLIIKHQSISQNSKKSSPITKSTQIDNGVFYLIQLEPEKDTGRFKLGFANNIDERLRTHRCSAPFAVVIKTWPCHLRWEKTAIDCVTQGCEKIHTEVFRARNIEDVKINCDQFFSIMPNLKDIMR